MKVIDYFDTLDDPATRRLLCTHLNYYDILANADKNSKWVWIVDDSINHTFAFSLDCLKELANVSGSTR